MWEVAISILLIGAIYLFTKLAESLAEEHSALKLLFLLISFFLVILASGVAMNIAKENNVGISIVNNLQTFYKVTIYVTVFVVGYFIVYYVYKVLRGIPIT